MNIRGLLKIFFTSLLLGTVSACQFCPPAGPWPQPPGCGTSSGTTVRDDLGCFPLSCNLIPDARAALMCKDFKAGMEIWSWPDDCTLMPISTCLSLCEADWQRHHEVGLQNWEAGIKERAGDWFMEPYTKVYMFGAVNERFEILQPDGQLGAYGLTDRQEQLQVDYAHFYNMPAIAGNYNWVGYSTTSGGIPVNAFQEDQIPEELWPAMGRDLDGNIAHATILESDRLSDRSTPYIVMHSYHPAFLAKQVEMVKRAIDFGADGAYFDNLSATPGFKEESNTFYDKFDEDTLAQFNEYLDAHLVQADWNTLGVDAEDFNYASFLKNRGYTVEDFSGGNEAWKSIPLIMEFRTFISESNVNAFAEIARQAREYAQSKGRVFTISGNMTDPYLDPVAEIADYRGFEAGYVTVDRPYQYTSVVPADKFSMAKESVFLNYIWAGNYAQMRDILNENEDVFVDVYRLSIMENYAARAGEVLLRTDPGRVDVRTDNAGYFEATQDTTYLERIKTAFDFMRTYKPYFVDFNTTNAKVALLYLKDQAYQENLEDESTQHYYDSLKLGTALYERGVDYDMINASMSFEDYQILFLPSTISLDDGTAQKMLDFVKQGGTLIMMNQPRGLLQNIQEGPLEDGSIDLIVVDSWDVLADDIRAVVGSIESGEVGLHALSYQDDQGNYIVHLFTPQTDLTQSFQEYRVIPIQLPFSIAGMNVSYISLENPHPVSLDAGNIVIPVIKTYGLLVIEKP